MGICNYTETYLAQTQPRSGELGNRKKVKPPILLTLDTLFLELGNKLEGNGDILTICNVFEQADKEDLYGNRINTENDVFDDILNENEQKRFLQILKEKHPRIYSVVNNIIAKLKKKSDAEIIADNFFLKKQNPDVLQDNKQLYTYNLEYLNNNNLLKVLNEYENPSLLYDIYQDACERANKDMDEVFSENETFESEYEDYRNNILNVRKSGKKDLKILEKKCKNFADYLLKIAKQNKIYTEDYARVIAEAIENKDIKNLTIAVQRLADRIIASTDKDKSEIKDKAPNGEIDADFAQGYTGDCWFITALSSLCDDKDVLKRINDMITVNKENGVIKSVTVNIQGHKYVIDYKNLKSAKEYAVGDLDVRALEIAVNQYIHENNLSLDDISLGGDEKDAYKILFGENNVEVNKYVNEKGCFKPDKYIEYLKKNKNKTIFSNISIAPEKWLDDNIYSAVDNNGKQVKLKMSHSYKYKKIDEEYIYFTDPQFPKQELHVPIKDFGKIFDGGITVKIK